jgi:DNA modification methylase
MVEVFREVRRVLRDDGTLWLNLGDSYANANPGSGGKCVLDGAGQAMTEARYHGLKRDVSAFKPKDLCGIPWLVAFALRADGWYLRQDIIWAKPNQMPESVTDRCTKSHEYIFLLSKSARYYYDADAIAEAALESSLDSNAYSHTRQVTPEVYGVEEFTGNMKPGVRIQTADTRNKRSVWTVTTKPFPESHFATFPPDLIEPCIKAGSREGDTVLDPFNGAGTTGLVATRLNRNYVGIELNPEYVDMSRRRITNDAPLFNSTASGYAESLSAGIRPATAEQSVAVMGSGCGECIYPACNQCGFVGDLCLCVIRPAVSAREPQRSGESQDGHNPKTGNGEAP